jgi:regulator of protease activity HflC (stomatin/prohibitin superfamily)
MLTSLEPKGAAREEKEMRLQKEMRPTTRLLAAAALMGCLSISAVSAQVQSPSPGPSTSAQDLSDQKLDATAAALQRVASLQQDYRQRVAAAQEAAEKERIVAEANNELTKAVTDQGLSVEEYASILDVARGNPEIRGKILQRIQPPDK